MRERRTTVRAVFAACGADACGALRGGGCERLLARRGPSPSPGLPRLAWQAAAEGQHAGAAALLAHGADPAACDDPARRGATSRRLGC